MVILEQRPHFICCLREEAPFYWVNLGGGWCSFFIYVQNYAGGWLEFYFMVNVLPGRAGHLYQVILVVLPYHIIANLLIVHPLHSAQPTLYHIDHDTKPEPQNPNISKAYNKKKWLTSK